MNRNQAFTVLQQAGGIRAARVITENTKKFSRIYILYLAHQLRRNVPVAKLIHKKWFYGLCFYTNKYTLDPRPDTETLVAAVLSDILSDTTPRILDLGTGTGCIICSLVKNISDASGIAIDKSRRALNVARHNIKNLGLESKIKTIRTTFNRPYDFGERFDIIVSNPPYIPYKDSRVDAGAIHDPHIALYAANNGLAAYQSIAKNAKHWIKPDGKLFLEIGINQGTDIKTIFISNGWDLLRSEPDLAGIERVLVFTPSQQNNIIQTL